MSRDYYYSDSEMGTPRKHRSFIGWIIDLVALVASIVCFVAMFIVLVAPYVDPVVSWIFPIVGLVSPAIYLATLILMLYWIIRWRWTYVAFLLSVLLLGVGRVSLYAKMETSKHYGDANYKGSVKILTYNIRSFINDEGQVSTENVVDYINEEKPDIIAFQEYFPKRLKDYKKGVFSTYNSVVDKSQAIYTRYKIINHSEGNIIDSIGKSGETIWADLLIGEDTIRVYNNHLNSTTIKLSDNEYISKMDFVSDSARKDKVKNIFGRFKTTAIVRADQADVVSQSIKESPYKVIVCGDFNDTPNSYTYHHIASDLQDAFQECGVGYSYTFIGFLNLLRIDYILTSKDIDIVSYYVNREMLESDHLTVISRVKFK